MKYLLIAAALLCVASPSHARDIRGLVTEVARQEGVPPALAHGVVQTETNYRCGAIGSVGERGAMQVRPSTARGLGYRGPAQGLSDCRTGITWGMRYLKLALAKAGGAWMSAATKYNRGVGSSATVSAYGRRVMKHARS